MPSERLRCIDLSTKAFVPARHRRTRAHKWAVVIIDVQVGRGLDPLYRRRVPQEICHLV